MGMMGGAGAHEFMAPSAVGENVVARSDAYAANLEIATSVAREPDFGVDPGAPVAFDTAGINTIAQLAEFAGLDEAVLAKSVVVVTDDGPVLAIVRGEHQVSTVKLTNHIGAHRAAHPEEILGWFGANPGSLGPVGMEQKVRIVADTTIATGHYVTGANQDGVHLRGVALGRDFQAETADIREVMAGEGCPVSGVPLELEPVIEVGNIFKLGTRYSEPLEAKYLDQDGAERLIVMGSYGIGPARIAAAAIEHSFDDAGIVWPKAIAPFDIHLVAIGNPGDPQVDFADQLYDDLSDLGLDVLYDDRIGMSPGQKFVEAELLGCPVRVTIGKRTLPDGPIEVQVRQGREKREVPLDGAAGAIRQLWEAL